MTKKKKMVDVQNRRDNRNVDINKVGVKSIKYPITVLDKKNKTQHNYLLHNSILHFKSYLANLL